MSTHCCVAGWHVLIHKCCCVLMWFQIANHHRRSQVETIKEYSCKLVCMGANFHTELGPCKNTCAHSQLFWNEETLSIACTHTHTLILSPMKQFAFVLDLWHDPPWWWALFHSQMYQMNDHKPTSEVCGKECTSSWSDKSGSGTRFQIPKLHYAWQLLATTLWIKTLPSIQ